MWKEGDHTAVPAHLRGQMKKWIGRQQLTSTCLSQSFPLAHSRGSVEEGRATGNRALEMLPSSPAHPLPPCKSRKWASEGDAGILPARKGQRHVSRGFGSEGGPTAPLVLQNQWRPHPQRLLRSGAEDQRG